MKFKDFIDSFRGWHIAKLGNYYTIRKVNIFGDEYWVVYDTISGEFTVSTTNDKRCIHDNKRSAQVTLDVLKSLSPAAMLHIVTTRKSNK